LKQTLGVTTIFQFPHSITARKNQQKAAERLLDCIIKIPIRLFVDTFKEKVKKYNGWNRGRVVRGAVIK
jgi:hypothetical protein